MPTRPVRAAVLVVACALSLTAGATTSAASSFSLTAGATTSASGSFSLTAATATSPATPTVVRPALQEMALNWGQQNYLHPASDSVIVLSPVMHLSIAGLKAANPNVKVLMYDNIAFASAADCSTYRNTAVSYCDAIANHPSWLLRTSAGQTIPACDFTQMYWMDPGNPGYQAAAASDAVSRAKSFGFDGVFLDDVDTHPGHCKAGGGLIGDSPSYSDEAYGSAMVALMSVVGPAVKSAGMVAEPNMSADPWTSWQEGDAFSIAGYSTRVFQEFFERWNCSTCGVFTGSMWLDDLQQLEGVQNHGASYGTNVYSVGPTANPATILYTRATLMLGWSGGPSDTYQYQIQCNCSTPVSTDETLTVGAPTGLRYPVGYAWRRDFTNGTVIVNPNASYSQTINLGGCYVTPAGTGVTQITISPATGTILSKCPISSSASRKAVLTRVT